MTFRIDFGLFFVAAVRGDHTTTHGRSELIKREKERLQLGQQKMLVTLVEQEDLSRKWNQPTASTSPRTRATTSGGEMRRRGEQW